MNLPHPGEEPARKRRVQRHAEPPMPYSQEYTDTAAYPVFHNNPTPPDESDYDTDADTDPDADIDLAPLPRPRRHPLRGYAVLLVFVVLLAVTVPLGASYYSTWKAERAEAARQRELAAEKAKYKLEYRDLIEYYAAQQGIKPALVAAVIYNESRYNPQAVSNMDARGLMQIRKDTGDWIAMRLGETKTYEWDNLFDPDTNIRYGTWFLGYLARTYDGDIVIVAAGYHAGQGRVAEWLQDPRYSRDGTKLDVIPYADTEQYVRRVVAAYEIYTRHYYPPEGTEGTESAAAGGAT